MPQFDKFAKLFDTDTHGQILCIVREDEDDKDCKPIISFQCQPIGLGICTTNMTYDAHIDPDIAWDKATAFLESLAEDEAKAAVQPIFDATANIGGAND